MNVSYEGIGQWAATFACGDVARVGVHLGLGWWGSGAGGEGQRERNSCQMRGQ